MRQAARAPEITCRKQTLYIFLLFHWIYLIGINKLVAPHNGGERAVENNIDESIAGKGVRTAIVGSYPKPRYIYNRPRHHRSLSNQRMVSWMPSRKPTAGS